MNPGNDILLAGTGRRCINPPAGIAHGGWGAQKHEQAEGIDMDLWVTVLALTDAESAALIVDVDIQILTNEIADRIRAAISEATKLPADHIRASATHTHSGPVPYKSWIEKGFELVGPWFEEVCKWSAEAAVEALANRTPTVVRTGRGDCRINVNRRASTAAGERFLGINRAGATDHEVQILNLESPDGGFLATVVNYACHPTIMGPPNRLITPDYPGAMKRVVERALGGKCLFLQGAAGDQGPVRGFQDNVQVYRSLGSILGHEVVKIALGAKHIPTGETFREIIPSGAPLGMYDEQFPEARGAGLKILERDIPVPLREGLPERKAAGAKLAHWKEKLKEARRVGDERTVTEAIYMARRADIQLRMADDFGGKTSAGVRTHFICFGDVALVGCNIEPFCEMGMFVKRSSPFPFTCVSGYTNGRMAYMATAEEWPRGGYEVENSPFGQHAAETLQREILQTLNSMRQNQN